MPPGQEVVYHGNGIKAKWEILLVSYPPYR
jgi:hypothetical protein